MELEWDTEWSELKFDYDNYWNEYESNDSVL